MIHFLKNFLKHRIGLDRAIAASTLTQLMRLVTAPITMFLMVRHFTAEEQGFYYSFSGVIGLQIFLEAGFAQSITQFTSKEFASLRFNSKGVLTGRTAALSRLRSLIKQANRYYQAMAAVLTIFLAIGGYWFFSTQPNHGVHWQIPWFVVCISTGIGFLVTPLWALLEGCNQVSQVASYRLWSTLGIFIVTAAGLILDLGIYIVVLTALFNIAFSFIYLGVRWRSLIFQILRQPGDQVISWRKDVWGFQWRIALSWMARYATDSAIVPLVFATGGAAMAGKLGMTLQLIRMGALIATNWSATKLPHLGALLARGEIDKFERIWKSSALRNLTCSFIVQASILAGLALLPFVLPDYAARFMHTSEAFFYSLSFFVVSFLIVMFHYTRAGRADPLYMASISSAVFFILSAFVGIQFIGVWVVGLALLLSRLLAVVIGYPIWVKYRNSLNA